MRKFLVVVLVISIIIIGLLYYLSSKLHYQPEWYEKEKDDINISEIVSDAHKTERQIKQQFKSQGRVEISEEELSSLVIKQLQKDNAFKLKKAVKAVKSTITPTDINLEMVVDVNEITYENIPPSAREIFNKITGILPEETLNDLYVKIKIDPVIKGDYLTFGKNSQLYVGGFKFTITELNEKLGLQNEISLNKFQFSDFELKNNSIVLYR